MPLPCALRWRTTKVSREARREHSCNGGETKKELKNFDHCELSCVREYAGKMEYEWERGYMSISVYIDTVSWTVVNHDKGERSLNLINISLTLKDFAGPSVHQHIEESSVIVVTPGKGRMYGCKLSAGQC